MRTLGGEGPLSHGLRRASSPKGRAKGGIAAHALSAANGRGIGGLVAEEMA